MSHKLLVENINDLILSLEKSIQVEKIQSKNAIDQLYGLSIFVDNTVEKGTARLVDNAGTILKIFNL